MASSARLQAQVGFALLAVLAHAGVCLAQSRPSDSGTLCLVPFPKEVKLAAVEFTIEPGMTIFVSGGEAALQSAADLRAEITRRVPGEYGIREVGSPGNRLPHAIWISGAEVTPGALEKVLQDLPEEDQAYRLDVTDKMAAVGARTAPGLLHGAQTLRQLVRANLRKDRLGGLVIRDWPSLKRRGFSDDITRGPSPTPAMLEREVDLTALLRMNFFTYYLEYQYAFSKHPQIGPADGSLKPSELAALVEYAGRRGVEIIGNQQSFGHFAMILRHEQYKDLRETPDILTPVNERTYQLLDDLYSEQAPLLPSELFNVCCDETQGLGTGPSKSLAERVGVGGVYTGHLKRVHELLKTKYRKRMMMWGDIILMHPEHLPEIPRDTVMLSWGYEPQPSFEEAILPFARSGYEFFVCPGVSCWSRVLPDFAASVTNISNYVRDGAKHGTAGVLNTTWDDDGENLGFYNWYGIAWGAECAWNASATPVEDFNRRVGAVLFGESSDNFGQAVATLGKAHGLPAFERMFNAAFWQVDVRRLLATPKQSLRQAEALLKIVGPALDRLRAARARASVDAEVLDAYIFGAKRMQLMGSRILDCNGATVAYKGAVGHIKRPEKAQLLLTKAQTVFRKVRQEHADLKDEYVLLWNRENRPYALDRVTQRFDAVLSYYDEILARLDKADAELKAGRDIPSAMDMGLEAPATTAPAAK